MNPPCVYSRRPVTAARNSPHNGGRTEGEDKFSNEEIQYILYRYLPTLYGLFYILKGIARKILVLHFRENLFSFFSKIAFENLSEIFAKTKIFAKT